MGEDRKHNSPPTTSSQHSLLSWGAFSPQQTPMASATLCAVPCGSSGLLSLERHTCSSPFPKAPCVLCCRLPHSTLSSAQVHLSPAPISGTFLPLRMPRCSQGNPPPLLRAAPCARDNCHEEGGGSFLPLSCPLLRQKTIKYTLNCRQADKMCTVPCTLKICVGRWADMACQVPCFVMCHLRKYQRELGWRVSRGNELRYYYC